MAEAIIAGRSCRSMSNGSNNTYNISTLVITQTQEISLPKSLNNVYDVLIFGGGGGGSWEFRGGAGGGGGYMNHAILNNIGQKPIITVTIGNGGPCISNNDNRAVPASGGSSFFGAYLSANGGMGGQPDNLVPRGGDGGTGGGGGCGMGSGKGGNAQYGGGGGGSYTGGGNGGIWGGGGGGGGGNSTKFLGGYGGRYGGNGGDGYTFPVNGKNTFDNTETSHDLNRYTYNNINFVGKGVFGSDYRTGSYYGGGGGGGYGGNGGNANTDYGGGGGGYGSQGKGGDAFHIDYNPPHPYGSGCGGGGGFMDPGGDGSLGGGGGGGGFYGGYGRGGNGGSKAKAGTNGTNGICIIQYYT